MAAEKAEALVLRTTDWSETSRIATLWTREFGKVRILAKGGRRLKSNFENALDLLTHCDIVLLRKTSGGLDLLTEARVVQRFANLRQDLHALYASYYLAELLADFTEENDPHPGLFSEALAALQVLGKPATPTGLRLLHFELVLLRELGYGPALKTCALCANALAAEGPPLAFSAAAGGMVCPACQRQQRERRPLSLAGWQALRSLSEQGEVWRRELAPPTRAEVRHVVSHYVTYLLGRRPRLLAYLGSP